MGAGVECRDGRLPPLRVRGRRRCAASSTAAGRERPGEVVRAARRPAGRGRDDGGRARPTPRPHRAHARRGWRRGRGPELRAVAAQRAARSANRRCARRSDSRGADRGPGRLLLGRVPRSSRRRSCPGSEVRLARRRPQPDADRPARDPRPDGRRGRGRGGPARAAASPGGRSSPATARCARHRVRARRGPAGDRRAAARGAARLLRRGRDAWSATRRSCATRSRTGSPPSSRG